MQFGTILDSVGKPRLNFRITTLGAVVNLTCNYLFITWFGLFGAAYGSLVAMTVMFVVMQITLNRLFNVQVLNTFQYMFAFYKEGGQKIKQFFQPKLTNEF